MTSTTYHSVLILRVITEWTDLSTLGYINLSWYSLISIHLCRYVSIDTSDLIDISLSISVLHIRLFDINSTEWIPQYKLAGVDSILTCWYRFINIKQLVSIH